MKAPLISVVAPVYGVEAYIESFAASLFGQTYDKIQFIIVNDGTKDASIEKLRALLDRDFAHLKDRVLIINKENEGLPKARETGLAYVEGDYVLHVDSDD
jgi:glycosyltransferase involved in cell wall biosynthesis